MGLFWVLLLIYQHYCHDFCNCFILLDKHAIVMVLLLITLYKWEPRELSEACSINSHTYYSFAQIVHLFNKVGVLLYIYIWGNIHALSSFIQYIQVLFQDTKEPHLVSFPLLWMDKKFFSTKSLRLKLSRYNYLIYPVCSLDQSLYEERLLQIPQDGPSSIVVLL